MARLHDALQEAFGWTNSHLHQFRVGRECFGVPDRDGWGGPEVIDERRVRLEEVADVKSRLVYEYDFGDGWEHDIVVERVDAGDEALPTCLDGRRARPPEDCGGPYGYENLLQALADPKHPEHAEMREWAGPYFQPEHFDSRIHQHAAPRIGNTMATSLRAQGACPARAIYTGAGERLTGEPVARWPSSSYFAASVSAAARRYAEPPRPGGIRSGTRWPGYG